jgi:hypothetical protein
MVSKSPSRSHGEGSIYRSDYTMMIVRLWRRAVSANCSIGRAATYQGGVDVTHHLGTVLVDERDATRLYAARAAPRPNSRVT